MTISKDERDAIKLAAAKAALGKAMRETPYRPGERMPQHYALTDPEVAALLIAAQFVLSNGGPEEIELEHLRRALRVLGA